LAVVVDNDVGIKVLGDAAKKSTTTQLSLAEQMGYHAGGGCFAMRPGHGDAAAATRQFAQHLRALLDGDTLREEVLIFGSVGRDGWGIYNKVKMRRDERGVVDIMHGYTLLLQLAGEGRWRAVVAADAVAPLVKVAGYGTHADASYAEKIVVHSSSII